jgi:hypothetical protein
MLQDKKKIIIQQGMHLHTKFYNENKLLSTVITVVEKGEFTS